jgi:cytochrome oxidase Cu insertion factor (SCO1/SenC/PrrC family)
MKPAAVAAFVAAFVAAMGATLIMGGRSSKPSGPLADHANIVFPADVDIRMPDFTLTEADGSDADASMFDGRYAVVDFIFTNCPFASPGMAAAMLDVQSGTAGSGVGLVSISVDGEHDTPGVLAAYAEQIGADGERWAFLTGPTEDVRTIIVDGLKLSLSRDESRPVPLPGGGTMPNYDHPTRLLLIGPDRRVIASASFQIDEEIDGLIDLARRLDAGE